MPPLPIDRMSPPGHFQPFVQSLFGAHTAVMCPLLGVGVLHGGNTVGLPLGLSQFQTSRDPEYM